MTTVKVVKVVKGKITRQIDVERKEVSFAIYIDGDFPDCPIGWTNELALELAKYLPIKPIELLDIVEKHLKRVGRINETFKAPRYHDDVKLTNSFVTAFNKLLKDLEQRKLISNIKTKIIKVNPSLYPQNQVSEGIVTCEVPVMFFKFEVNNNV